MYVKKWKQIFGQKNFLKETLRGLNVCVVGHCINALLRNML